MAFWRRGGVGWWSRSLLLRNCITAFLPLQNSGLKVKNQSGQWEGPGGGELNGCIMHRVHTSTIRTRKNNYNKNQQKQQVKEKEISVLRERDLFCATKCVIRKESDVALLENHKTNVREKVKMM
jgi:hypothetical protein